MSEKKTSEEKKANEGRRKFLVGAAAAGGLVIGGVIGSQLFSRIEKETITTTTTTTRVETLVKYKCPYCGAEFDSATALEKHIMTHIEIPTVPAVQKIKMKVNGKEYEFVVGADVKPNTTLWELLKEKLGYASVKDMCTGGGECGSCTVLVDGRPVLSCLTLAIDCDGKDIWTAEGIAEKMPDLPKVWADFDAVQCGYCTPGVIVTVKALLDRNPRPTKEEILEFLSGNICVCGTYLQWPKAVLHLAEKLGGR